MACAASTVTSTTGLSSPGQASHGRRDKLDSVIVSLWMISYHSDLDRSNRGDRMRSHHFQHGRFRFDA